MDDTDKDHAECMSDNDQSPPSILKLSCEQCRQKKVKCDRRLPCEPCTRKGIPCSFPAGYKQREKRRKALISNTYESKIDEIVKRLDDISMAVASISTNATLSSNQQTLSSSYAPSALTPASECDSASELEGDMSLNAHAAFATDYVQRAMSDTPHISQSVASSLVALREMLDSKAASDASSKSPRPAAHNPQLLDQQASLNGLRLPPLIVTMSCLQNLTEPDRLMFLWSVNIESVSHFREYVLPVYSGQPSIPQLVITNLGLYSLFGSPCAEQANIATREELAQHAQACLDNVESILRRLPFNLPSTFDYVLCLTQVAMHYLEMCKPLQAWNYIVMAAQMCYTLGYNRKTALVPEAEHQRQRRIKLVWCVVMLDNALALRLGRPSTLREKDLVLDRLDDTDTSGPISVINGKWVEWSLQLGRIYDQLFSPEALLQPENIRAERATALATESQAIFESISPAEQRHIDVMSQAFGGTSNDIMLRADKVAHLSTMCLIYRAVPADPYSGSAFSEECVNMAHKALKEHQRCVVLLRNVNARMVETYLHWAILCTPFVPFVVLFCRVVETNSTVDLDMLASVIEALQLAPIQRLPVAFGKQLRLFKLMYDVACRYVEAKRTEKELGQVSSAQILPHQHVMREGSGFGHEQVPFEAGGADMMDLEALLPYMGSERLDLASWFDQSQQMMRMMGDDF